MSSSAPSAQKPPTTTGDDDSKSDDAMCGSSVAMTEAEEDNASYAMSVATAPNSTSASSRPPKGLILTKDSSLEISINNTPVDVSDAIVNEDDHGNAAPMHFHVLRTPARLRGAPGRSRSSSRSRPGSRRNSASPIRGGGGTLSGLELLKTPGGANAACGCGGGGPGSVGAVGGSSPADGMSGSSSLADLNDLSEHSHAGYVNPDILLDKLGFRDLDPNVSQAEMQELLMKHLSSNSSLPTLNERMSEETMEDVHAFQDLVFVKKSSDGSGASAKKMKKRVSPVKGAAVGVAVGTGAAEEDVVLEEGDEEEEDDESSDDGKPVRRTSKLTLNTLDEAAEEEDDEDEEDEEGDEETGDDDDDDEVVDDDAANKQISPPSSLSGDENDDAAVEEGNLGKAGAGAEVDLHNLMSELDLSNARREGQSCPSNARVSTMAVAGNGVDFDLDAEEDDR
ncbi:hypothetical protein ACHAXS_006644 [Conticribra weissflogii]